MSTVTLKKTSTGWSVIVDREPARTLTFTEFTELAKRLGLLL
jgi:hypothetical protein